MTLSHMIIHLNVFCSTEIYAENIRISLSLVLEVFKKDNVMNKLDMKVKKKKKKKKINVIGLRASYAALVTFLKLSLFCLTNYYFYYCVQAKV